MYVCVFLKKKKCQSEREDRFEKTNQLYNELPLAESGLFDWLFFQRNIIDNNYKFFHY